MKFRLTTIAFLVLASTPLAAEELLRKETLLDLKDLARAGDWFGTSVALSGDGRTLVVGAAQAGTRGTRSGAVHVFRLRGEWQRDDTIRTTGEDTTAFDVFGYSVAVNHDGTFLAVGAPLHDHGKGNAGAVYVWRAGNSAWEKITAADPALNDNFGTSVALNGAGTMLVVGAPQPNPVVEGPSGKAYVFEWQGVPGSWIRTKTLVGTQQEFAFFGFDVAVDESGERVIVGAPGLDSAKGGVYVCKGEQINLLTQTGFANGAELGFSVAISSGGSTIVAGARGAKTVKIFEESEGKWEDLPSVVKSKEERFGTSVAVSRNGDTVLVGSPGSVDPKAAGPQGAVYFFRRTGTDWRDASLSGCDGEEDPSFGQSVALSETGAAVGMPFEDQGGAQETGAVCAVDLTGIKVTTSFRILRERSQDKDPAPGEVIQYEIAMTNLGNSSVDGIKLLAQFDGQRLAEASSACEPAASCSDLKIQAGSLTATILSIPVDGTVTITLRARVRPEVTGRLEALTVTLALGSQSLDLTLDQPHEEIPLEPRADLQVKFTDHVTESYARRGSVLDYQFIVRNDGPSHVGRATVAFQVTPGAVRELTWSCKPGGAACPGDSRSSCTAGKCGFDHVVNLPPGRMLTYKVTVVTWDAAALAAMQKPLVREVVGKVSVRSKVKEEDGENNAGDVQTILPIVNLDVTLSATVVPSSGLPAKEPLEVAPGETLVLTAKVANLGPDSIKDVILEWMSQPLSSLRCAAGLLPLAGDGTATCVGSVDLLPGFRLDPQELIGKVKARVPAGEIADDAFSSRNEATLRIKVIPRSELKVVRSDDCKETREAIPGERVEYCLDFKNDGPSNLLSATFSASISPNLSDVIWKCEPSGTATCSPSGMNEIKDPSVVLPAKSSVRYTISGLVSPGDRGDLRLSFGFSSKDSVSLDITSLKTTLVPIVPIRLEQFAIEHLTDPKKTIYVLTLRNIEGPSALIKGTLEVRLSSGSISELACVTFGLGVCEPSKKGMQFEDDSIEIPVQAVVQYFVVVDRGSATTGDIHFQFELTGAGVTLHGPVSDLEVTKSFDPTEGFRITITNHGPSDALGVIVMDDPSDGLKDDASWTCQNDNCNCKPSDDCTPKQVDNGCSGGPSKVLKDKIFLAAGASVAYSLSEGSVEGDQNTACIRIPAGLVDPVLDNNSASATKDSLPPPS